MEKSEYIWNRMARYLAGEMNMNEEIAFVNEIKSDPQQQSELKKMEKTWKYFIDNPAQGRRESEKAWDQLKGRLEEDGLLVDHAAGSGNRNMLPILRIAASILLILAIGIPALYFGITRNGENEAYRSNYAEEGISTVDLPDGSRVYLNEGAKITYPAVFDQGRSVELDGEAFFEVMSDPVNPFSVRSGKVVVSVLGTSFNVKRTADSKSVEVYVESGKVRMALDDSEQFITLEPGDVGHSSRSELSRLAQTDPNYISWKTKDFKFVDTDLMEVLLELEESYHVEIHTGSVDIKGMKITTTYQEQSIDAILETIGTAFGLSVSNREDGYYLTN
jgi:ferric-dicitrate binding protein FerR (iron transport regulator)